MYIKAKNSRQDLGPLSDEILGLWRDGWNMKALAGKYDTSEDILRGFIKERVSVDEYGRVNTVNKRKAYKHNVGHSKRRSSVTEQIEVERLKKIESKPTKDTYMCVACGHGQSDYLYQCPKCMTGTFEILREA